MFLSRVEIDWGSAKNPYNIHRAVWKLFPGMTREPRTTSEESRQGFLFCVEKNEPGDPAIVLVQSPMRPQMSNGNARIVASKEFHPSPSQEQRLAFVLTANPVKTITDANGRLNRKGESKKCRVPLIVEDQQVQWLVERLAGFATIESVSVRKLPPIFFYKQKEKRSGKLIPVLFEGFLNVHNPTEFVRMLQNGLGPAKAFGCGLMLVRRL